MFFLMKQGKNKFHLPLKCIHKASQQLLYERKLNSLRHKGLVGQELVLADGIIMTVTKVDGRRPNKVIKLDVQGH